MVNQICSCNSLHIELFDSVEGNAERMTYNSLLALFPRFQVPATVEKVEGPSKYLTFLGIEIDNMRL